MSVSDTQHPNTQHSTVLAKKFPAQHVTVRRASDIPPLSWRVFEGLVGAASPSVATSALPSSGNGAVRASRS